MVERAPRSINHKAIKARSSEYHNQPLYHGPLSSGNSQILSVAIMRTIVAFLRTPGVSINISMDTKELKRRAGIVEQVDRTDEEIIRVLELAISKMDFGSPDDARYYITQVIQTLRARAKQQPS